MINIIEHLWQYQIKNFAILPTTIKIANQTPKTYFYSQKNLKVLRKKNQSIQTAAQTLQISNTHQRKCMVIKKMNNIVEISLGLSNQVFEYLSDQSLCSCVIGIEGNKNIENIIKVKLDVSLNFTAEILISKQNQSKFWSATTNINLPIKQIQLKNYVIKLWKQLAINLKTKSKFTQLQIILATNKSDFYIIWCNKLLYEHYQFYQIDYEMISNDKELGQQKKTKKIVQYRNNNIDINKLRKQQQNGQQFQQMMGQKAIMQKGKTEGNKQGIKCNGCQCVSENATKQVSNEQIVKLRRGKKLSIKGLHQDYYVVCQACYYLTDE